MSEEHIILQQFKLEVECELRFEVETKTEKVTLELKSGLAEVFGTLLVQGEKYEFTRGAKVAVFTWHGCTLELTGKPEVSYIAKETPMRFYRDCFVIMEIMRVFATMNDTRGPTAMVVGARDVGKSTLCKLLLNYAVRMGRSPCYVDLDSEQGDLGIPGTIGALLVERPLNVADAYSQKAPLIFHFGHKTPSFNTLLYNHLVTRLAEVCAEQLQANKKSKESGIVINTCGWIKDGGCEYKLLTHAAEAFHVDKIFVLDQEKLYHKLLRDMPKSVEVILLPKSGGIVKRSQEERNADLDQSVREYFYGSSRTPLYPHNFEIKWSEVKLWKIGVPILSPSCMPFGIKAEDRSTKLVAVTPRPNLLHHLLSISFADPAKDDVARTNVVGFVCVTNVDVERQTFTILSQQPRLLPNNILLLSEIQFMDTN